MSSNSYRFYEFGPFRIDASERVLFRGNDLVPLTPKAFDLLLVLVRSEGHVVTKDDLMKSVWPDSFVEEANLSHNVYKLREALGESGNGEKFIQTLPRRGYRFIPKVVQVPSDTETLIVQEHSRAHIVIEEDDDGVEKLSTAAPATDSGSRFLKPAVIALVLVALIGAAVAAIYYRRTPASSPAVAAAPVRSIAVLPFKPLVAGERDESLELGMADTLISRLSAISGLKVSPFSAVRRYTKLEDEVSVAGSELNVDAVLDGSIQKAGDRVRVSVRLVRVNGGQVIWAEQFDERLTDIFSVEDSIARRVGNQIAPRLNGEEQAKLTKSRPANTDAYLAYLKGRYFFRRFNPADNLKAGQFFNEAVAKDPNYAVAYSGLCDYYAVAAINNWQPALEAFPKARAAAQKALSLDDSLAEVHTTMGAISMFYDLDWSAAEREFKRAIELNPNYPESYEVYSYLLSCTGRLDEGIEMAKRGLEVDPLSVALSDDVAGAYYWAHRFDEAIAQSKKSIDLDSNHAAAYLFIGESYELKGNYSEAIAAYQKSISLSERTTNLLGFLGHAYALSGRRNDALKIVAELTNMSHRTFVSPYDLALVYTGLGDNEKAIEQLNRAYTERAGWIVSLKIEPIFDPLRSDPRFIDLEKRMNFP
ncbi:MAG TPA: winged helix-turn-helix domain-containing protein [Pyrinomonadaceae bacterium]|nr:winged helix-turn-helix domain-containing protein [Pyrinomonadaceae bacterium]